MGKETKRDTKFKVGNTARPLTPNAKYSKKDIPYITDVIHRFGGVLPNIASELGITKRSFYNYLSQYPELQKEWRIAYNILKEMSMSLIKYDINVNKNVKTAQWFIEKVVLNPTAEEEKLFIQNKDISEDGHIIVFPKNIEIGMPQKLIQQAKNKDIAPDADDIEFEEE